jgi:hypothetical protein
LSDKDFEKYKKFEEEKQIPVFIAVGLGNEGAQPERLFIVPLRRMKYSFTTVKYLEQFEKEKIGDLFYDFNEKMLR